MLPNQPPYEGHARAISMNSKGISTPNSTAMRFTLASVGGREGYQLDDPHGSKDACRSSSIVSLERGCENEVLTIVQALIIPPSAHTACRDAATPACMMPLTHAC